MHNSRTGSRADTCVCVCALTLPHTDTRGTYELNLSSQTVLDSATWDNRQDVVL